MRPLVPARIKDAVGNSMPMPPKWFDKARDAKYVELGSKIMNIGIWDDLHYDAFVILVDNLIGYEQAAEVIVESGSILAKGKEGQDVRHPATIAKNACWSNIQPLLVQFGLTPSALRTMGVERGSDIDPMKSMFEQE